MVYWCQTPTDVIFQCIINCQSIQAPLRIRSGPYPGFCLITVNPEDVTDIVLPKNKKERESFDFCNIFLPLIVISI